MDREFSSVLAGVQAGTEHLLATLVNSSASSHSALRSLVQNDSHLKDSVNRLEEHQALVQELDAINSEAASIEARLGRKARQGTEAEEQVNFAISRAEMLLETSPTRSLDPAEVCRYAQFVASTTSAPPYWRPWKPLLGDGRVLQPQPLPQEVFLPPRKSGSPSLVPCMTQVSWLKASFIEEGRRNKHVHHDNDAEPARKRPRQEPGSPLRARNQVARRVVAGLSDDEDDSD